MPVLRAYRIDYRHACRIAQKHQTVPIPADVDCTHVSGVQQVRFREYPVDYLLLRLLARSYLRRLPEYEVGGFQRQQLLVAKDGGKGYRMRQVSDDALDALELFVVHLCVLILKHQPVVAVGS